MILKRGIVPRELGSKFRRDSDLPLKLRFAASGHDDTGTIRSLPNSLIYDILHSKAL